jgi:hypothetical protein
LTALDDKFPEYRNQYHTQYKKDIERVGIDYDEELGNQLTSDRV